MQKEMEKDIDTVKDANSTVEFTPVVQLRPVEVDTGERDEQTFWKGACSLYRYWPLV
eukprot:TRINITY_DN7161_c0_g1_i1.p1 TRINITY_DN7161_c0_g1~~TRINITY_DN7161_c0_g1_i1.p1  ORF type:complete len:57 (+),score=20.60 TRINITY_DN7161_c0_g1_i1:171-341(+)